MDLLLILIIVFLPLIANIGVKTSYAKYSKIKSSTEMTGEDIANKILAKNGLSDIDVVLTKGTLTDHYNPKKKTVALSSMIFDSNSIASVSVAAHEVGHALQDKEGYSFMRFRSAILPVVNISSWLSTVFILIGIFTEIVNLYYIGILLLALGLVFQLITLPIEFNASKRAKAELERLNLVSSTDLEGTNKMLKAAAYTYVAGFLAMAAQVIRLIGLTSRD